MVSQILGGYGTPLFGPVPPTVNSKSSESDLLGKSDSLDGPFKIVKEEAVAQGIRRIKAVLE